jgi:hypothetical protein
MTGIYDFNKCVNFSKRSYSFSTFISIFVLLVVTVAVLGTNSITGILSVML